MPVRFTSPSLGGQRESFLEKGHWQIGVAYRRLRADKWFVGTQETPAATPFGRPLSLDINSLDFSVTYGVTHRLSLMLTVPFSSGTQTRFYADTNQHHVNGHGLGDVNLVATYWLRDPDDVPRANASIGLGMKSPSGNNHFQDDFWLANGTVSRNVVDQSVQLGDGGWGVMLQVMAYQRLSARFTAYFVGSYLLSLRDTTDVPSPIAASALGPAVPLAVPDVYQARAGLAFGLAPSQGVSASLGARIDGIPQGDIIGGRDLAFRRPGYTLFVDPTVSWRRGGDELTLSMPIRVHQNFQLSDIDKQRNRTGGGDLADYLVFFGYTHRF